MLSPAPKAFDFLLAGHDTVECAYYLHLVDRSKGFDFERLACEREALRANKDRTPQRNAPAADGSNWHMDFFGRDCRRHIALIDGIVREAQAKFNLAE